MTVDLLTNDENCWDKMLCEWCGQNPGTITVGKDRNCSCPCHRADFRDTTKPDESD